MTAVVARPARGRPSISRLAWMFARPSADSAATLALPAVTFAITTALLLIVTGGTIMFWQWPESDYSELYRVLSVLALALLVIPLAGLSGAAARLSARRRDDRLATLRLLGATPSQVARITVLESVVVAAAGAFAGIVLYLVVTPLVGLITFKGEPIGAGALLVSPVVVLAVVAGVIALAAVSSIVGLRRVVISPLGVRIKQSAPRLSWVRGVIGVVVIAISTGILSSLGVLPSIAAVAVALGIAFAVGVAVLNLIGPWVIGLVASIQVKRAKVAHTLISSRTIMESPQAAWRQVSGVAMASFVAVVGGTGVSYLNALGAEGVEDGYMLADVRTGILITLVGSFLMVACSVGVNQASAILDRRDLYVNLDRVGMPRPVMEKARARAIMAPLRWVSLGSGVVGAIMIFPLAGITLILAPTSLLVIAGAFVLGFVLVALATRVTRPILSRVLARPERA
ncbi:FtsX-like permease family protein [Salinibacterium hongtaonis]|uniref:Permease n=1 Tax=Homoserinimonas hongtaonis TaxID=2079791 RepID=A0A2U1SXK9_9MICO|nr:FtsX-like permease family protein [Salinibacterium hongtaonis]PWB96336.1 permease [Salinibacterium hongtaonis]